METSRTNAQYKRNDVYNLLYKIEWILSVLWIFFVRQTRQIRQIQRYGNQAWRSYNGCCNKNFILFFIYYILLGRILQLPRGKGHKRTSRSYSKVPHLTHPPIPIRKTATAPGSPYSFRIVRGFFYVPQNYQHSRNCETGPPTYRPYPRRLESLTVCRWYYKGSTFSSVI